VRGTPEQVLNQAEGFIARWPYGGKIKRTGATVTAPCVIGRGCTEGCLNTMLMIVSFGLFIPEARGDRSQVIATEYSAREVLLDVTSTNRKMRHALEEWAENEMGGKPG
jgi:hypothetical protein